MPYRYLASTFAGGAATVVLTAGSQGLTVTAIRIDDANSGTLTYDLQLVTSVSGGSPVAISSLDAGAPTQLATAVNNPTDTPVSLIGEWRTVGPTTGLNLAADGPIEVAPGAALQVEKSASSPPFPIIRIYFEE